MKPQEGYDEMLALMADFASAYLGPAWERKKAGQEHALPTDTQFSEIFYGFSEIGSALEALALTEELLRLAPPRSKRIDKDNYLKFLVGAYLQELYILEQRLTAYAKKISRLYRTPSLPSAVRKIVYEPLEGIINTRGMHVHQRRFTDERLDMVSTLALFRRVGHKLGEDLEFEYKFAQMEWKRRVRENNQATRKIAGQYCKLLKAVICRDGKVVFPKRRIHPLRRCAHAVRCGLTGWSTRTRCGKGRTVPLDILHRPAPCRNEPAPSMLGRTSANRACSG